jgi:elongation factor Ts
MKEKTKELPYAVFAYVHHNRRVASLVTIRCKTDFALRTDLLQDFGNKVAMHASAFGGVEPDADWILDSKLSVKKALEEVATQLGEPVIIDKVAIQGLS